MPLTNYYVNAGEGAVATYDYFDFAARTGYKKFYLAKCKDAAASYAIIVTNAFDSNPEKTSALPTLGSYVWEKSCDQSFDLDFQVPNIVQGYAYSNITSECADLGANSIDMYLAMTVYHVSGSGTETQLDYSSSAIVAAPGGSGICVRDAFKFDVPTTKIKAGEKIRCRIEIYSRCATGGSDVAAYFWHDPSNRNSSTYNNIIGVKEDTDAFIILPFKIDL